MISPRLLGVVLCGGRSSRMGSDKKLLTHPSGDSFLEHAISRAATVCDEVCLSAEKPQASELRTLVDPVPHQGPISGVITALTLSRTESFAACFVTPIDMPMLSSDDLCKIKAAWKKHPQRLVCAVCEDEQRIEPLVAIYPTHLLEGLQQVAASGHRSLQRWIEQTDHDVVSLSPASCHNINTPDDLP